MEQYLNLCKRILNEGTMIKNERTGKGCLTVINANFEYNVGKGEFPLVTTRKSLWKGAIAELLGYIRGYSNAEDFAKLGAKTWFANANENEAWLKNPHRKGENDMGFVYGAVGRNFPKVGGGSIDLLKQIVEDLKNGRDNRGEIYTFYNPGAFHLGCLRPCLYSHQFSLLGDTLYLNSTQRSTDVPLGLVWNMVQCYVFLALMARITGHKAGIAYHNMVNAHIYDDQIELMKEQVQRKPFKSPTLIINPKIKTLEDLETWVTPDDFELVGYEYHPPIKYPFSV